MNIRSGLFQTQLAHDSLSFVQASLRVLPVILSLRSILFFAVFASMTLTVIIGYGVGPYYDALPAMDRLIVASIFLIVCTVICCTIAPMASVLLYAKNLSLTWLVFVLPVLFSSVMAAINAMTWTPRSELVDNALNQFVLDTSLSMLFTWPWFLIAQPLILKTLQSLGLDSGRAEPKERQETTFFRATWYMLGVFIEAKLKPIILAAVAFTAIAIIFYGVGPYYGSLPLEKRTVVGLTWVLAAVSIALFLAPPLFVVLYRLRLTLYFKVPLLAFVFSVTVHTTGLMAWASGITLTNNDLIFAILMDALLCALLYLPGCISAYSKLHEALGVLHPSIRATHPTVAPQLEAEAGNISSLISSENQAPQSAFSETKNLNQLPFRRAVKYRLVDWTKFVFTPKLLIITFCITLTSFMLGVVPSLPESPQAKLLLTIPWVIFGVPLFVVLFTPLEVLIFRMPFKVDVVVPLIFVSFLTALNFVFINEFLFTEFFMSEFPFYEGLATSTFITTLTSRVVYAYGPSFHSEEANDELHHLNSSKPASEHDAPKALLRLLPPTKRGPILGLSAVNKSTAIRTSKGTHIVRMSLSAATAKMPGSAGTLIHRAHWVAYSDMDSLFYEDGNPRLRLLSGDILPVSRKAKQIVKEALRS